MKIYVVKFNIKKIHKVTIYICIYTIYSLFVRNWYQLEVTSWKPMVLSGISNYHW